MPNMRKEGEKMSIINMHFFDPILALYGLTPENFNYNNLSHGVAAAVTAYEADFAPQRFQPHQNARQLFASDFNRHEWWEAVAHFRNKYPMRTAEGVYCLLSKLLLIPHQDFNPLVECQIEADGIPYNQISALAYPHPKNRDYYLIDGLCQFDPIIIRPAKPFNIIFGKNDFTAMPVGIALTQYPSSVSQTNPQPSPPNHVEPETPPVNERIAAMANDI